MKYLLDTKKEGFMKIVRAMKERSRLEGQIKDIKHRMENCLKVIEGNLFPEDFSELFEKYNECIDKLANLKNAIMKANMNNDMYKYIIRLGELKHHIVFLKELEPINGRKVERFGENTENYISQISEKEKNNAISSVQKEINEVTDFLDNFNAMTDIGEMEEIALSLPKIID